MGAAGLAHFLDQIGRTVPQQPERGFQRRDIVRRVERTEKGKHAPHLIRFQKIPATADDTGNIVVTKTFFNKLQLTVRTAEHGDVGKCPNLSFVSQPLRLKHINAAGDAANFLGDEDRFGKIVRRVYQPDRCAGGTVGREEPRLTGIPFNDRNGGGEDFRRRTIIFRQTDLMCIGKISL